jgi:hypothetical protein
MSTAGVTERRPFIKRARLQEALLSAPTASLCQLYTCQHPFESKRAKGKKQLFCSIGCRVKFFQEARVIGAALLKKAIRDSKARDWVIALKRGQVKANE